MKKIKILKTLLISTIGITAIGTIAAVSTSCSSAIVLVTSVSLDKESLTLGEGDSDTLTATVYPDDASDKSVTWFSSDSSIATVDNNGNVAGVSEGQATISVTTKDGAFTDTCQVTVHQKIIHVIGVWLSEESLALGIDGSETLTATVLPENATDKLVTWSSSNSSVATVDNNGKVTAVREGQATITVTTNDGGFTDTCQVAVHQKIHVIGVLLDKSSLELGVGGFDTLIPIVLPESAADKSVTWSSNDSSVATVDNNGKVTAVSEGSAKITVTTNDGGYEDYCDVTVTHTAASYMCVTANADSTLELINNGDNNPNLRYSLDGSHWTKYSEKLNIPANEEIYLRGNNTEGWSLDKSKYSYFNITGNVSISGNVMGLLDNGIGKISSIPNDYCFNRLFEGSTGITSVSEDFLPATKLATGCYYYMFISCSSLTTAPTLPATTLAESCYYGMFSNCASLTTVYNSLPARKLANHCYHDMFAYCTSLTAAPDLPATTLASDCYRGMFYECITLKTAPKLPATKLPTYCYGYMFCKCTSLKIAPYLPATELAADCYRNMFSYCSSLTNVPLVLPAKTLVNSCYSFMFQGCTSLTAAPELPATTLADYCYEGIFLECTNLTSAKLGYVGSPWNWHTAFFMWFDKVSTYGTFYYNGDYTLTNLGVPSSWTIQRY